MKILKLTTVILLIVQTSTLLAGTVSTYIEGIGCSPVADEMIASDMQREQSVRWSENEGINYDRNFQDAVKLSEYDVERAAVYALAAKVKEVDSIATHSYPYQDRVDQYIDALCTNNRREIAYKLNYDDFGFGKTYRARDIQIKMNEKIWQALVIRFRSKVDQFQEGAVLERISK